ncbi:MAG: hypothetical protein ACRC62_09845 [Microcoleus sp.]
MANPPLQELSIIYQILYDNCQQSIDRLRGRAREHPLRYASPLELSTINYQLSTIKSQLSNLN